MNLSNPMKLILICAALLFCQIFIFDAIHLKGYGKIMVYPLSVLLLPADYRNFVVMLIGFSIGLILDFSLNTGGLHAAALTALAYARSYLLNILKASSDHKDSALINLKNSNLGWYFVYTIALLLVHQLSFYLFEKFSLYNFFYTIEKALVGTIFSTLAILLILLLFKTTAKERHL